MWAVQGLWWVLVKAAARSGRTVRELRDVCDVLANLAHNGVLLVIMVEVCLIYSTAGWFKIQGTRWQDGTAVYYPMKLDDFTPWPELSSVLAGSGIMIFLVTYGTVATQVAFPFTLLNRRVKNVLLAMMIIEHLSIAVVLGLPFFSLAMIAADAVFLPTVFLVWVGTPCLRPRDVRLGCAARHRACEGARRGAEGHLGRAGIGRTGWRRTGRSRTGAKAHRTNGRRGGGVAAGEASPDAVPAVL